MLGVLITWPRSCLCGASSCVARSSSLGELLRMFLVRQVCVCGCQGLPETLQNKFLSAGTGLQNISSTQ